MKIIKLSNDMELLIDNEDYELIKEYNWYFSDRYVKANLLKNNKYTTITISRIIMKVNNLQVVDHINGNTLDNQKCNLRICSLKENARNKRKLKLKTSKYKGVHWSKNTNKWRATIQINGKNKHLGLFKNEKEAANTYNNAAIKYYGEFACLNEI